MVAIVPAAEAEKVTAFLTYKGEKVSQIGTVTDQAGVEIEGLDEWRT